MRCGRTFRLAKTHPAHARSSGSETLSRSRSLVDYTIDTHGSEFSEATPPASLQPRRENRTRRAVATTRPPASPQRRRENRTRRAVATTRPPASPQRRRENLTRRAVATTRPPASPQQRRENRTRRAVAVTAPIPNRVPPAWTH